MLLFQSTFYKAGVLKPKQFSCGGLSIRKRSATKTKEDKYRTLREYAMYVERVRTYAKQMPLAKAVEKAVDYCIEADILSEFLRDNRAEAIKMSIYEYDEELHFRTLREEGFEEGREHGERRLNKLNSILIDLVRIREIR